MERSCEGFHGSSRVVPVCCWLLRWCRCLRTSLLPSFNHEGELQMSAKHKLRSDNALPCDQGLDLDLTNVQASLLSSPPFAAAFVVSLLLAFASDRFRWRWLTGTIGFSLAIIGTAVIYSSARVSSFYVLLANTCKGRC